MKQKVLIIATAVFFLLVNTSYFWEGKLGFYAMPVDLLLVVYYVVLAGVFVDGACIGISTTEWNHRL